MISVKQILYWTQLHRKSIILKARNIGISIKKVEYVKEPNGIQYKKVEVDISGETKNYDVLLYFQGKGLSSKVWASCSCEYFLYHCEYALSKSGSSDINFSNGKMPKITNPRLVKHCCKHIAACLQRGVFLIEPKDTKKPINRKVK